MRYSFFVLGIIGLILKYITPLTIAPAVAMVGMSLFDVAARIAAKHWGIAIGYTNPPCRFSVIILKAKILIYSTISTMILFSQYLRNIRVPCPSYDRSSGFKRKHVEVFQLFPVRNYKNCVCILE